MLKKTLTPSLGSVTNAQLLITLNTFLWVLVFFKIWLQQYVVTPAGVYSGGIGSWADGAVHLTYAAKFAYGDASNLQLPIYKGHPFSYPFISDLATALFTRITGLPVWTAHSILGFILSVLLLLCLTRFYLVFLKSARATCLAILIFLLSGGLGFVYFFSDIRDNGIVSSLTQIPRQYTHQTALGIEWITTISGQLIPQRALLGGLILGLYIISDLWIIVTTTSGYSRWRMFTLGLGYGILPLVHPHTFLVVTCLVGWCIVLTWKTFKAPWLFFIVPSWFIAAYLISNFIIPGIDSSFLRITWGWLSGSHHQSFLEFWFLNWGIFIPLALIFWITLPSNQKTFTLPFAGIFILANIFVFQPNIWDNSKFFSWVYLVFSGVIAVGLVKFSTTKFKSLIVGLGVIVLILSGLLDTLRLFDWGQNYIPMYSSEELAIAEWVRDHTSTDSVFLTSDRHSHPIPNLTGRQIFMGYRGWLWTYGIDARSRTQDVIGVYAGTDVSLRNAEKLGINYVVIDPSARQSFKINEAFFKAKASLVLQTENYQIFKVFDAKEVK